MNWHTRDFSIYLIDNFIIELITLFYFPAAATALEDDGLLISIATSDGGAKSGLTVVCRFSKGSVWP